MARRLRTQKEIRGEQNRLERLSERWPDLGLALWLIAWMMREGPSPSSVLELLEEKAGHMLTEEYVETLNRCRREKERGRP